jgi:D-alanyl-D-alanine dipeptidase
MRFAKIFITCMTFTIKANALPEGFVYLNEVDPSIQQSVRYYSKENFVGKRIEGYNKPTIIITKKAAEALKKVNQDLNKDGYTLVVYDGYRPQRSVDEFAQWGRNEDDLKKSFYYPMLAKREIFEKGFVATKSTHSRGSTADITIIKSGLKVCEVKPEKRGDLIFLNDCTEDMGMHFDFFGEESHSQTLLISPEYNKKRLYLTQIMEANGFKGVKEEWWHFTLKNEPFPETYFNFEVK